MRATSYKFSASTRIALASIIRTGRAFWSNPQPASGPALAPVAGTIADMKEVRQMLFALIGVLLAALLFSLLALILGFERPGY